MPDLEMELHDAGWGEVHLRARSNESSPWFYLLKFTSDGDISLIGSVPARIGIAVDAHGKVIIKN